MTDDRIATLDALRGVAVMGILVMNIVGFALPDAAYTNPDFTGPASTLDRVLWTAGFILVDGKMRGLFALLFGAGILLAFERAEARGEPAAMRHLARMAALLVLGLAHFYLFWPGDILTDYAIVGLVAIVAVPLRAGLQLTAALLCFAGATAAEHDFVAGLAASRDAVDAAGRADWAFYNDYLGWPTDTALATEAAEHRLGFVAAARERIAVYGELALVGDLRMRAEVLGFMLLGMAALRSGALIGGWSPAAYRRLAWATLPLGLAAMTGLAAWCWRARFDPITVAWVTTVWSLPVRPLLVAGLVGLLAPSLARADGRLTIRLRAAGRTALTNYLGATILFAIVFAGWGFGLWGELTRAALAPLVAIAWVVMLAWPKPWLERFAFGPFEWLWRSLAAGKPLVIVRQNRVANVSH